MAYRLATILCLLLAPACRVEAATGSAEQSALNAAAGMLSDEFYPQAEQSLKEFARKYPNSPRLAEALLLQAEAEIKQTNYSAAIDLLSTHQSAAGTWADQYLFWIGKARYGKSEYTTAADSFARLVQDFPASSRRLEALVNEAAAFAQIPNWRRVVELLQQTNGIFQTTAVTNAGDPLALQGFLLLSEAQLALQDSAAAEAALQPLTKLLLPPRTAWQWNYLLGRIRLAQARATDALSSASNMLSFAAQAADPALLADGVAFQAGVLEQLGRLDEAIAASSRNLTDTTPPERRRQAFLKIAELSLRQNKVIEAIQTFNRFLAQNPQAPASDLAWLTVGELQLRQHLVGYPTNRVPATGTNALAVTNYLVEAQASLEMLARAFPQSPLLGRGQLDLGWCFWLGNKMAESEKAFRAAAEKLGPSPEQAKAYFKLADAQFRQNDFSNALLNYRAVIDKFSTLPEVKTNLFEPALYQSVRAALAARDLAAATNSLAKLLAWFPKGFQTERAFLVAGQQVGENGSPAMAREILSSFVAAAPDAPLAPEVRLAIARTFEQEERWPEAIAQYESWLATYTNHEARPAAMYYEAKANFLAGRETNALEIYTNLVARFPTNEFAPSARWWVGDYYYAKGDYANAEAHFRPLAENSPASILEYQARMAAGRCAFARGGWTDAIRDFTNLTSDVHCPGELWLQAMSAYGDTVVSRNSTNKVDDFWEAIRIFDTICRLPPTNSQIDLAWGQLANSYLQWAQASHNYDSLTNASKGFQRVLDSPRANTTARSIATVGLGVVLEAQAAHKSPGDEQAGLLNQALAHYLAVVYGNPTVVRSGDEADIFWIREAALKAGHVAEKLQQWSQAINIYQRLKEMLPALSASFDNRIRRAQQRLPID